MLPELNEQGKDISDLIKELKQPAEAQEARFPIQEENYQEYGQKVIDEMKIFINETFGFEIEPDNEEGIRANVSESYGSGWFILRLSLHEPLLVLQVENDEKGANYLVFEKLEEFLKDYGSLELGKLYQFLER